MKWANQRYNLEEATAILCGEIDNETEFFQETSKVTQKTRF